MAQVEGRRLGRADPVWILPEHAERRIEMVVSAEKKSTPRFPLDRSGVGAFVGVLVVVTSVHSYLVCGGYRAIQWALLDVPQVIESADGKPIFSVANVGSGTGMRVLSFPLGCWEVSSPPVVSLLAFANSLLWGLVAAALTVWIRRCVGAGRARPVDDQTPAGSV